MMGWLINIKLCGRCFEKFKWVYNRSLFLLFNKCIKWPLYFEYLFKYNFWYILIDCIILYFTKHHRVRIKLTFKIKFIKHKKTLDLFIWSINMSPLKYWVNYKNDKNEWVVNGTFSGERTIWYYMDTIVSCNIALRHYQSFFYPVNIYSEVWPFDIRNINNSGAT